MIILDEKKPKKTVKKTLNVTENNWKRIEALVKGGCYPDGTDAINDLVRRGLPIVETETGIRVRM